MKKNVLKLERRRKSSKTNCVGNSPAFDNNWIDFKSSRLILSRLSQFKMGQNIDKKPKKNDNTNNVI